MIKAVILIGSVLLSVVSYYLESAVFGLLIGLVALLIAAYDAYKNKLDLYNCLTLVLAFQVVFLNFQFI